MIEWKQMTMQEAENKMEVLREIFDVVRLLKGSDLQAAGMERKLAGRENLCQCYAFWNKDKRCENCISLKALEKKKQTSKIEFLDSLLELTTPKSTVTSSKFALVSYRLKSFIFKFLKFGFLLL